MDGSLIILSHNIYITFAKLSLLILKNMSDAKKKQAVKKKEKEFTAENIDNTAPVQKILDELQDKNNQAYLFYSRNIKQRLTTHKYLQNYHCAVPGHPLKHFDDDWDGQFDMDYFEAFPYKSLPPKMISMTLKNIEKSDPVTSYMKSKMEWHKVCYNLKDTASFNNMMNKYESLNDEVVQCPKHIVDMAAHIDSDPDPYFDSSYNWYYAGHGNLQLVCIDWVDYLLYSEFSTLYLSEFNKNELFINPEHAAVFDCGDNILEIICNSQYIVVLRTKFKIFVLKIVSENETLSIEKIKCSESELPYTSVTFDDYHKNILYVTTIDYKLSIVNLDRLKARSVKLKGKVSLTDNWNSVLGSGRAFYTHIGRQSISIYDKRSNNTVHVWNNLRNITDELSCNDISVARFVENFLYFATDHHLFLMDLRNIGSDKVVQRWTHGMECVPIYMNHCNFEMNKDLIVLSSQWCEDMCILPNYNSTNKSDANGVTIPYRPPNILDTLDEARQQMLCNDLYNPIDSRLCTAITGLLLMESGEKYDILMQNSLGDLTCHTLFPEYLETFIENNSPQNLHNWSLMFKLPEKTFEVSYLKNIANVWKKLKKLPDDYKIEDTLVRESRFKESDISDAFDNEEIDVGLQEVWSKGQKENESELVLKFYLSDDED